MFFLFLFLNLFQFEIKPNLGMLPSHSNNPTVFNLQNFVPEEDSVNLKIDLSSEVVLIKEFNGKTLLNKNADLRKPIASLTKLMSSYLIYSIYSPTTTFIFDRESIDQPGEVGNFRIDEEITRDDALKASLVSSSNDAIFLLAKTYGLEHFVKLMNQKAKEFGMMKTQFFDPTGADPKNISTAYDLYLLSEKIYSKAPEIFYWTTLEKVYINNKILWTTNLLLPKYKNFIVGAKTGFTDEAGECLLMILKFNHSPFISVILLNSKDRFQDAEKVIKVLRNYYGD